MNYKLGEKSREIFKPGETDNYLPPTPSFSGSKLMLFTGILFTLSYLVIIWGPLEI